MCSGEVDASAIDSHVLALAMRDRPVLTKHLRVIDSLGPSTIQPVVVARKLPARLKADIRAALLEMSDEAEARPHFDRGLIERFVAVDDASYDDLREMRNACERATFTTLH